MARANGTRPTELQAEYNMEHPDMREIEWEELRGRDGKPTIEEMAIIHCIRGEDCASEHPNKPDLPASEFYPASLAKGVRICKECQRQYSRERYAKKTEQQRGQHPEASVETTVDQQALGLIDQLRQLFRAEEQAELDAHLEELKESYEAAIDQQASEFAQERRAWKQEHEDLQAVAERAEVNFNRFHTLIRKISDALFRGALRVEDPGLRGEILGIINQLGIYDKDDAA